MATKFGASDLIIGTSVATNFDASVLIEGLQSLMQVTKWLVL